MMTMKMKNRKIKTKKRRRTRKTTTMRVSIAMHTAKISEVIFFGSTYRSAPTGLCSATLAVLRMNVSFSERPLEVHACFESATLCIKPTDDILVLLLILLCLVCV